MKLRCVYLVLCLGLLAVGPLLAATTVAGVVHADSIELHGVALPLNGVGVRYKALFRVYTAAVYLPQRSSLPEEVLAMAGPKRISITMLREIDAAELGKLFIRGVEDNTERNALSQLVPSLYRMGQIFAEQKRLLPGDTFVLDWIPGTGTRLSIKGQVQGQVFAEEAFFQALLRIWLGSHPADEGLKKSLLGPSG